MAEPMSASFEALIQNILTGQAGLPASFNPARRASAYETAAHLGREGYSEDPSVAQAGTDEAGNITYRVVRGLDGKLYRQAFRQTQNAAASRGTLESSFTDRGLREDKIALDKDREAIIRGFEAGQASSFSDQADQYRGLSGDLSQARGEYADWRAQQPVALPVPQPPALVSGPPPIGAPHPGSGTNSNILGSYKMDPNRTTLDKRFGAGAYDVKKRGPKVGGYVVVRR